MHISKDEPLPRLVDVLNFLEQKLDRQLRDPGSYPSRSLLFSLATEDEFTGKIEWIPYARDHLHGTIRDASFAAGFDYKFTCFEGEEKVEGYLHIKES